MNVTAAVTSEPVMKTPVTDRARRILAPFKHLIPAVTAEVDELLKDIEALEARSVAEIIDPSGKIRKLTIAESYKSVGYARKVECPQCGAGEGEECVRLGNNMHVNRMRAALVGGIAQDE